MNKDQYNSEPPSYESVMQGSQNKSFSPTSPGKYPKYLNCKIENKYYLSPYEHSQSSPVDTIGQSTHAQPSFTPTAPTAPFHPDYGSVATTVNEVIVTQPSQPLLNLETCPVCRMGETQIS